MWGASAMKRAWEVCVNIMIDTIVMLPVRTLLAQCEATQQGKIYIVKSQPVKQALGRACIEVTYF